MFNFKRTFRTIGKFFLGNSIPMADVWGWMFPKAKWNIKQLLLQYNRYTYAIITAIAEEAAKIEFEVYKDNDTVNDSHPFKKLIKRPNPQMSQFQFLEMHFTFMKLCGESFWYIVKGETSKKPKELYLLNPALMDVAIADKLSDGSDNPRGLVTGYVMKKPNGTKTTFEVGEILHFKTPNPLNPYRGMGVVQAAKDYIQTEEYSSNWTKNSIYNSGRPSGVLNIKGLISDDQFIKIKKQFKDEYSGAENAGKTMLLKGMDGFDYQKLGMELNEVAVTDIKNLTRDDIMVMFRVSKTILGISDDVNRANAMEARAVFTRNVIIPEVDRMIDHINAFLMPLWDDVSTLKYEDPTLQTDQDRLAEWTAGYNKWLTINDIRSERKLDPLPGGDVIRDSIMLTPITGNAPESKKGVKKDSVKKKEVTHEDVVNWFVKSFNTVQLSFVDKYKEFMNQEYEIQLKEILSHNKTKSEKAVFTNWLFDVDASQQRIQGTLYPISNELMQTAAALALQMAKDDQTQFRIDEAISEYLHERIDRLAKSTNDETIQKIEDTIGEGIKNGEDLRSLRNRVKDVYSTSDTRAERIARTESLATSNAAAEEAYRQSPLVVGKEWHADGNPCPICQSLDGKVVEVGHDYAKQGQTIEGTTIDYEDLAHPPAHPNCMCILLPVVLEK